MATPIHTDMDLSVTVDDLTVAAAAEVTSGYDDVNTSAFSHDGETYIIIDTQSYSELKEATESPIKSIDGLSQECIDIIARAIDSTTLLCREHANSRFFRISWTVSVTTEPESGS